MSTYVFSKDLDVLNMRLDFINNIFKSITEEFAKIMVFSMQMTDDFQDGIINFT